MHPKDLSINDYNYSLPFERIAAFPLEKRDDSKLLIYKNGEIKQDFYRNISSHIPENALMIFNETKVIEARILFQKQTGGVIEIFCLEPEGEHKEISTSMMKTGMARWQCLVGGASKWKPGQVLEKKITTGDQEIILHASYIEKRSTSFIIEFNWKPDINFAELLHIMGAIPLPPYIKREPVPEDAERYQTIFAKQEGSVAAPTAGLHFTNEILNSLTKKNISTASLTLHVGAGTFKPVKTATMQEHEMHAEYIELPKRTLKQLINGKLENIIAVGTTSFRTLETVYWLGVKLLNGENNIETLSQWYPYEYNGKEIAAKTSLMALLEELEKRKDEKLFARTELLIAPGYKVRMANALVTNFHQPQSTLLLLVAACIGEDWKKIYDYALKNDFRFLSYGDGGLLWVGEDREA
jgi:S-adenosylmethionine:tRNA ribosyltransferase-isomerase